MLIGVGSRGNKYVNADAYVSVYDTDDLSVEKHKLLDVYEWLNNVSVVSSNHFYIKNIALPHGLYESKWGIANYYVIHGIWYFDVVLLDGRGLHTTMPRANMDGVSEANVMGEWGFQLRSLTNVVLLNVITVLNSFPLLGFAFLDAQTVRFDFGSFICVYSFSEKVFRKYIPDVPTNFMESFNNEVMVHYSSFTEYMRRLL